MAEIKKAPQKRECQQTEKEKIKRRFDNAVAFEEWVVRNSLHFYPSDHPAVSYTKALFEKGRTSQESSQVTIHVYRGEANAFCLPNGAIFVSDGLIKFAPSEEGLRGVLGHEKSHISGKHAEKTVKEKRPLSPREILNQNLSHLGQQRFHEWEADILSFTEAEKLEYNPLGYIELMEKIRATSKGTDIVHGQTTNRILNLRMVTQMQDIATIQEPLHPVSEEIQNQLLPSTWVASEYTKFLDALDERKLDQINRNLKRIQPEVALLVLPEVISNFSMQRKIQSESARNWATIQEQVLMALSNKIRLYIDDKLPTHALSDKQKTMLFHTTASLLNDADTTDPTLWTQQDMRFQEQFYTKKDITAFFHILSPEIFSQLEIKLTGTPDRLAIDLTKRVLEKKIFTNDNGQFDPSAYALYVYQLTHHLRELYEIHGIKRFDREELVYKLINGLKRHVGEQFEHLRTETIKLMPEMEEIFGEGLHPAQKLVQVCTEYISSSQANTKKLDAMPDNYKESIKQLLAPLDYANPQMVLTFLADFREKFQNHPRWVDYTYNDTTHNQLSTEIFEIINNNFFASHPEIDNKEKFFWQLKIALLVSSQPDDMSSPLQQLTSTFNAWDAQKDISLSEYKTVYHLATGGLDGELGRKLETPNLLDYGWENQLQETLYTIIKRGTTLPHKAFHNLIEQATTEFTFNHYGITNKYFDGGTVDSMKNDVLATIFQSYSFSLDKPEDLKTLYYLSTYFENTSYAVRLQNIVLQKLIDQFSFTEGLAFFEKEAQSRRMLSFEAFETFIDKKAITHEQIKKAKEVAIGLITRGGESKDFGKIIVAEEIAKKFFPPHSKKDLLFAAIGKDDRALKTYLYTRWQKLYDLDSSSADNLNLESLLSQVYSLDAQSKYLVIRDLLVGEHGLLMGTDLSGRKQLVDLLLDSAVEPADQEEREIFAVMKDVMHEFAETASFDMLYFALAPLLQKRFLTPTKKINWQEIILKEQAPLEFIEPNYKKTIVTPQNIKRIKQIIIGNKQSAAFQQDEKARNTYESIVDKILRGHEEQQDNSQLSVAEFLDAACNDSLGAPGTRFRQLIGQYISLSPRFEKAFYRVYDRTKGQSKISADQTLLRDWTEAETEMMAIREKLGGGALMTAFLSEYQTEGELTTKVLNPNAAFHTQVTYELLSNIFTKLAARNPQFEPALPILEDIKEWIIGDINYTGFLEQDKRFREQHDGYTLGGQYKIKIPKSYGPERNTFAREEYIRGTNLTDLESLTNQGHDLKQIVSLLTHHLFMQITDGQVHSNIHIGNVRITQDNEVAILDRNFYQHLSQEDQIFLLGFMSYRDDLPQAANHCIDYLVSKGSEIDTSRREYILSQVAALSDVSDLTSRMLKLSVLLRKEGLRFPLPITLLVQNFFFVDRLAKKVGFSGIEDALLG